MQAGRSNVPRRIDPWVHSKEALIGNPRGIAAKRDVVPSGYFLYSSEYCLTTSSQRSCVFNTSSMISRTAPCPPSARVV
jgi:hypothetical protein